ncbi:MAG TPA: LPS assembly protein LptD [Verrucomicrobiae bacterium]|nr:LPS assembly protein LptD [Verrucomicrobiae bacterium]
MFAGTRFASAADTPPPTLDIQARTEATFSETNGLLTITNGVLVKYTDATGLTVLTADRASINQRSGDIFAEGGVHLQKDNETWAGEKLHYNYETKEMEGDKFRLGKAPFYVAGEGLHGASGGSATNGVYQGTNVLVTTDDYYEPLQKVRAQHFTIVPGEYVEAHDATLYIGSVPVFYFPYYRKSLQPDQNFFTFLPGYRSSYGPYLLSTYNMVFNEAFRAAVHLDYRVTRGVGLGPDFDYDFGKWGQGSFKYYYIRDHKPGTDPDIGTPIPKDRDRVYFSYHANPATNLNIMSQVAYQRDAFVVRDFFESQYQKDIQPNTFFDANQFWNNWSLDALVQPRLNPYWETVERLPDVRLTGFKQQLGNTPVYYESQSSVGYFRRLFADTNTLIAGIPGSGDFSGSRADTFHQLSIPETFFGWLTITPKAGARFTYYDSTSGVGADTTNHSRTVLNTGAEASFTMSRVWPGIRNEFFDVDGIRHIFQPSMDWVYVPQPSTLPSQLPQFDYQPTNSLRLLPIDYPDYNSIDSINSENTIRYGLNNRIQTKRNGELDDLVNWGVYTDWNLRPRSDETTFSDIYSDLSVKPKKWLTFNSYTRYSIENGQFNLSQHNITLQPNSTWNWSVGHLYLRSGTIFGAGDNLYTSVFFYKLNENWGTRLAHYFDATTGTLQEQDYTIYRDMRSWTAALTFRALNNLSNGKDYTVAFSFSLKSVPKFGLGADTVRAAPLVGY